MTQLKIPWSSLFDDYQDLPDFLQWCPCRGNVPDYIPYWWGETDLMANPITKMRVLGYGSEVMWATLAIPVVIISGGQALGAYSYSGLHFAYWRYPNAGGGGIILQKYGKRIFSLDYRRLSKGGKMFPHIDIPGFVRHWPW